MRAVLVFNLLTLTTLSSFAQEDAPTPEVIYKDASNSDGKYKGDTLYFAYDVILHSQDANDSLKKYCLPARQSVRVLQYSTQDGTYEVYRPSNFLYTSQRNIEEEEEIKKGVSGNQEKSNDKGKEKKYCITDPQVNYLPRRQKLKAKIDLGGFSPDNASIMGFSYGMLIVPYKYYTETKEFTGSATVAPYFGYRYDWNNVGIEIRPIAFVGPTAVTGINDTGESTNLFAVSAGGGFLFEIKNDFNMGFVVGKDIVSKSDRDNFENNNEFWLAISMGYDFSN